MRRRELFERTVGVTGLAALLAACGADPADVGSSAQREPSTTVRLPVVELAVGELAFVSPWKSLIDDEVIDFGISVMGIAPEAVDHARDDGHGQRGAEAENYGGQRAAAQPRQQNRPASKPARGKSEQKGVEESSGCENAGGEAGACRSLARPHIKLPGNCARKKQEAMRPA